MNCQKCNSENNENVKFCATCGSELIESNNNQTISSNNACTPNMNADKKKKELMKRFLIAAGLIVAIIIIYVAASGKVGNNVVFCTSVDKDLKPIGVSDKFDLGFVTVELKNGKAFNTDRIKVLVYKINGNDEHPYDFTESQVDPKWDTFALKLYLKEEGEYKVDFLKNEKEVIGSGKVTLYKK